MLEDNEMFHHPKLIADGLLSFKGNKEELALVLWEGRSKWSETMLVAIIQYITAAQDNFRAIFYEGLQEDDIPVEARIAILRYFQKYRYEPVREFLYTYIKEDYPELNCTIVAASVLKNYPGEETIKLLKDALKNPNWYILCSNVRIYRI